MLILTIRTDKPDAEVGLYDNQRKLGYEIWPGHRKLSATIHQKVQEQLEDQNRTWDDIQGVVVFSGPGSFTGLRIGVTVANTLAYGFNIPVVATQGEDWLEKGIARLHVGNYDTIALPEYGAPARITQQRK
jgi:tRNA threonylcarbamoyladenosine biosynthesis protein TsaB